MFARREKFSQIWGAMWARELRLDLPELLFTRISGNIKRDFRLVHVSREISSILNFFLRAVHVIVITRKHDHCKLRLKGSSKKLFAKRISCHHLSCSNNRKIRDRSQKELYYNSGWDERNFFLSPCLSRGQAERDLMRRQRWILRYKRRHFRG